MRNTNSVVKYVAVLIFLAILLFLFLVNKSKNSNTNKLKESYIENDVDVYHIVIPEDWYKSKTKQGAMVTYSNANGDLLVKKLDNRYFLKTSESQNIYSFDIVSHSLMEASLSDWEKAIGDRYEFIYKKPLPDEKNKDAFVPKGDLIIRSDATNDFVYIISFSGVQGESKSFMPFTGGKTYTGKGFMEIYSKENKKVVYSVELELNNEFYSFTESFWLDDQTFIIPYTDREITIVKFRSK